VQPSWTGLDTPFLDRLEDAGYGREDIDVIVLTHLHLDHVGWCAMRDDEGRWVPTFANARLVLVRDEYERHLGQIISTDAGSPAAAEDTDVDPIARAFLADAESLSEQTTLIQAESLQPVADAGLLELVPSDAEVVPGVRYQSTPGHTSAHHSVRLDSDGESAFVPPRATGEPSSNRVPEPICSSWAPTSPDRVPATSWRTARVSG
jgi:glyoxylase-like metal-dependent hydrolase (beta-lactamase superfamily II)